MAIGATKVVQVTNIAPQATKDQMEALFGFLGKIEDIRLYPTIRDVSCPVQSRICYIKFIDSVTVGIAQHMTNTVFIDRALIVIPVQSGDIPDEYFALEMTRNGSIVPGLCLAEPNLPPNVVNSLTNTGNGQVIVTHDPKLEANGLPVYPALPSNYDSRKIEEVRRTLLIVDIDPELTTDDVVEFFHPCEVKYIRHCTRPNDDKKYMFVEFSDQPTIIEALKKDEQECKGRIMRIKHATQAIVKPQAKSNEAAQREIEEAMSRVKEAQNLISATIDPVIGMLSKDKRSRRSRSRSRGRRRRSRSRSRSRKRSRSRHRSRRSRSKSRRSKSRERKKRSKSRSRRRSRSRSKSPRSRTSRRSKERKSREKSKERSSSKTNSKDKSPARSKDRGREEKRVEKEKKPTSRSPSKTKGRSKSRERERKRSRSRERKRSRSRDRKRSGSPSRRTKKRSRSRSKDREHRKDKKERRSRRDRTPTPKKNSEESNFEDKSLSFNSSS